MTPRLRTDEDMVTEQPLRSTDEGKVKLDFRGLIRIILVLSSLSLSLFTLIRISIERYMTEWMTLSGKVQRQVL